jgi:uncharacterized membrane protein
VFARVSAIWESLRASYWFLPTLMSLLAVLLSVLTIRLDRTTTLEADPLFGIIYSGGPEGSRSVLSVIAGSMITVTGIVFSITIVALSLASSQLGPRIMRAFIRDRGNQFVFGTFISTFIYCLLVLRTVHSQDGTFVPNISVTTGIALSLASLGVLIYFINHVAHSIQADFVIAQVGADLKRAVGEMLKSETGGEAQSAKSRADCQDLTRLPTVAVRAQGEGYLRAVDEGELLQLAQKQDLVIRLEFEPGDFIVQNQVVARASGDGDLDNGSLSKAITKNLVLGPTRTQTQDFLFLIDQLVQIALRALSPGINDPLTAINCIQYFGAALVPLAEADPLLPCRLDDAGRVRLIRKRRSFEETLASSLAKIRRHARGSFSVMDALLDQLGLLLNRASNQPYREQIREEMDAVLEVGRRSLQWPADLRMLEQKHSRLYAGAEP